MNFQPWFDYAAGYWRALGHAYWLSNFSTLTAQFLTTLCAGLISFFIANWTVRRQDRLLKEKKAAEDRVLAEDAVTRAFYKLIDCGEILGSMRNLLDEQFRVGAVDGYATEPYQIIRPSQGKDYSPERVQLSEIAFLSKVKDINLISDISLVYRRTVNCIHLSEAHSKERTAMHDWIQGLQGHEGTLDGDIANDVFPIEHRPQFERRAANLNLTISSWVEQIEDTIPLIEDVIERLGKASKAEFGERFPTLQVSFPANKITLSDIPFSSRWGSAPPRQANEVGANH